MIEFDVDMSYLLECDDLDKVVPNDESGEHEPMEFVPKNETLGRSCESCPEMDNPDSYIRHLSAALKGHDEHVPRPTNHCNMYTYGVLQGERPPDEVLFVGPDGGVTRYQTKDAGTCRNASKVMDEHGQARFVCSECHAWIDSRMLWNPEYRNGESPWVNDCKLNYCPNCGRRIEVDE